MKYVRELFFHLFKSRPWELKRTKEVLFKLKNKTTTIVVLLLFILISLYFLLFDFLLDLQVQSNVKIKEIMNKNLMVENQYNWGFSDSLEFIKKNEEIFCIIGGLLLGTFLALIYFNWNEVVGLFIASKPETPPELLKLFKHFETRYADGNLNTKLSMDIWHSLEPEERVMLIRNLCKIELLKQISRLNSGITEPFKDLDIYHLQLVLDELMRRFID